MPPENASVVEAVKTVNSDILIPSDCVLVDDKFYYWEKLADIHPGGDLFVKAFAGRCATEAFLSYHRRKFPHDSYKHALAKNVSIESSIDNSDYYELCAQVEKILPRHKSFAPSYYFAKIFVLLSVSFSLEYYLHMSGNYRWYLCGFLGFCFAWIGLNIQHDANHGSISRNPTINRIFGITQNWIGGSAIDWIHQHVVQHHLSCNDLHEDPDIMGGFLIRINPLKPLLSHHAFQHVYAFLMILMFGFSVVYTSISHVVRGANYTPMSAPLRKKKPFELSFFALYFLRWIVLPILSTAYTGRSIVDVFLNISPMFMCGGFYLALFFLISHNFAGVHMFDKDSTKAVGGNKLTDKVRNGFVYRQVTSSSNVGGPLLAFMNGGLNYQIEHHLFPRIQHSHYATIAPVVKAFCDSKGIPYVHFPTVWENILSCSNHLFELGHEKPKKV